MLAKANTYHRFTSLVIAMSLAGCATTGNGSGGVQKTLTDTFASDDPCANNARNIGIAVGVVGGILLSKVLDAKLGAAIAGAATGALVGGLIGANIDQKRCELSKIAKQYQLDMEFTPLAVSAEAKKDEPSQAFSMTVRDAQGDSAQFLPNSEQLTPRAREYFLQIAKQYAHTQAPSGAKPEQVKAWQKTVQQRRLLLIGHTDDTGNSQGNADLSERRAKAVAQLLRQNGVPQDQLYFQGAGEGYPIADNETEQGRGKNRRVEFVEVYSDEALAYYIENRRANYALYRAVPSGSAFTSAAESGESTAFTHRSKTAQARPAKNGRPAVSTSAKAAAPQHTASAKAAPVSSAATKEDAVRPINSLTAAASRQTAPSPVLPTGVLDFGGTPLSAKTRLVSLGAQTPPKSGFGLVSTAHASNDAPFIARCDNDRPRKIGDVKTMTGKSYRTSEHMKGLYGTTWAQQINGHLVVLNKVAVLRDGSSPQSPELKFYADYDSSKSATAKPVWSGHPAVNVYQGSNGLLYRVFANSPQGARCMDILFPQDGGTSASDGKLIYGNVEQPFATDFKPRQQL
ncbi:OmpA family protein [Comamonas aquatilis]|uniref:OmpA family protein n=1 Tax=Comamonas aquatilis TaxID=1778406 RepID=UPI0039F002CF